MRDQVTAKPERHKETRTHIHYSASFELTAPKAQGSAGSGATCSNTLFPDVSYCINRPSFLYLSIILTRLNWRDGGKAQCFVFTEQSISLPVPAAVLKEEEVTVSSGSYHLVSWTCVYCVVKIKVQYVHARIRTSDVCSVTNSRLRRQPMLHACNKSAVILISWAESYLRIYQRNHVFHGTGNVHFCFHNSLTLTSVFSITDSLYSILCYVGNVHFSIFLPMGSACGAYGAGKRGVQGSGGETWGKETIGEAQTQMGG